MLADAGSSKLKMSKPVWYQAIGKYAYSDLSKSLWQLLDTFVPYGVLWALMIFTVQRGYPYWVTLVLAVVAGGILVRVFILFHDCCHGSFFASHRANTILGYVSGILTFTPFADWRHAHNLHHATAGDLDRRGVGDIWTMTTAEYLAAPPRKRLVYRIYRNPFVLFGPGAALLFLFFQRFATKGAGKRERRSVFLTNVALLVIVGTASLTIGFQTYLLIQLPVILIGASLGLWLFYIQHQFESVYWSRHESWDPMKVALEGSSYFKLPPILQWFTGNIGLHHIHHVRPSIPNYNLQRCHDDTPAFHAIKPVTIRTSIKSLGLALYDEKQQKLISFRSLAALATR
ncbi:MAG: fatty acid desaturase [Deltaproteobacteria bacterium]|nr:fatty acid desaturase [Deltaproteobacteria bacterium]